ncbi:hypothetical protein ABH61_16670 [Bacillus paranthracis]|uniref:Uncharacterized protein n=2 Tax=Bacillus cereus group TaxID=86661 RepID=Q81B15_BACCR|nr:hypothetical protein BC_3381 [Bacillus cereus ATCC 14579]ALL24806.1 hypothetical protein BTXL6_26485 [Bacillus thuringiensis]KMQ09064.1 hypothetical protein TU68_02255 [Bacillus cereus]MBY5230447.1 hypothetical protein [Bacillus paranthracis]OJD43183.1 hypothetical protein BAU24_23860 [Bacillus sp. L27]OTZ32940.1 hypothetical protein BK761_15080 [Bacillus thuringiensis serovar darmstadiensis]TXR88293.1 hypothetical protein DN396_04415 [Bacillus sp. BF9-10]
MVRQISCILLINRNIQKANCDKKTAGFSTIRKIRLFFFTCCKGWKAFSVVAFLKKKIRRSNPAVICII